MQQASFHRKLEVKLVGDIFDDKFKHWLSMFRLYLREKRRFPGGKNFCTMSAKKIARRMSDLNSSLEFLDYKIKNYDAVMRDYENRLAENMENFDFLSKTT